MSTHASISVKLKNDTMICFIDGSKEEFKKGCFLNIYCHHDGYTSHVGKMLLTKFNNYDSALTLIRHGDISFINNDGTIGAYNNFGEDLCYVISENYVQQDNIYIYVYIDDTWYIEINGELKVLTQELIDSDF